MALGLRALPPLWPASSTTVRPRKGTVVETAACAAVAAAGGAPTIAACAGASAIEGTAGTETKAPTARAPAATERTGQAAAKDRQERRCMDIVRNLAADARVA